MKTYLEDAEALDGLEFLSMAEAGELAHWEILAKPNETANDAEIDIDRQVRPGTSAGARRRRQRTVAAARRGTRPHPSRQNPITPLRLDESRPASDPMAHRRIDVYLNDHLAGATFGADLARQLEPRARERTSHPR